MTTEKAIADLLINDDRWMAAWLRSGRTKQARYYLRKRYKDGLISLEMKDELLAAFGFTVKVEKQWDGPTK